MEQIHSNEAASTEISQLLFSDERERDHFVILVVNKKKKNEMNETHKRVISIQKARQTCQNTDPSPSHCLFPMNSLI